MLDLLDKLDNEFNCINNLGCWIRQEDPQILALTASLQNLQNRFSMLQGQYQAFAAVKDKPAPTTPPPPSSTKLNKPPQKKADDPEVIEFEGRTWKWCKKCFGGSWNRTHVTDEHQPGKGRSKNRRQPPPSDDTPPGASNQLLLRYGFCLKLGQTAMLAFSFILSLYHIITNTLSYRFVTSPTPTYPLLSLSHLPETLHLRFSNSVYIYMWFYSLIHTTIYISLSTFINFKHQSITPVYHSRPMRRCSQSKIIFILLYILANFCLVAANYHDLLPLSSLLSMPSLTLLYGLHHHIQHYNNHPFIPPYSLSRHTHLLSQPSDPSSLSTESSKLAYLYAWQCAQASSTKLMNFSPRGTPICIDTGASCFISNNKADFLHLEPVLENC